MCSIIGSKNLDTLKELSKLNSYRGTHSHSFFVFSSEGDLLYGHRGFGPLNVVEYEGPIRDNVYYIAHQQAPTTENKNDSAIHPAQVDGCMLWHNGIVKEKDIARLRSELGASTTWDTELILRQYLETSSVDNIDGTFSCVLYMAPQLLMFRNEISPMFINMETGDISSTKFENSVSLDANTIFTFNPFDVNMLVKLTEFSTVENPYYFG